MKHPPGGGVSADVIWGKKYEKGKRKREKVEDRERKRRKEKEKEKKEVKGLKKCKVVKN